MLSIFLPYSPDSGIIRNLECIYNNRWYKPLYCKWTIISHLDGAKPYYRIKITLENEIIYKEATNDEHISVQEDLIENAPYIVTVTPEAFIVGVPNYTSIVFQSTSKILPFV